MAKPRTPNQKKRYAALNKRLAKYVTLVQGIYDSLASEAASIVLTSTDYSAETGRPFRFKDYPFTKSRVNELMRFFSHDIQALIYAGTTDEWTRSNLVQDLLANDVLKVYGMKRGDERVKKYYQANNDALKAFQKRKYKGFTVSQKVWNQSYNFKQELEYAISSGIEKGMSAITLSKRISKYLHDFPALCEDYGEKYGKAVDCKNCEYRSIRLAASEINMAYRTAEQERWRQMDFIKGYKIKPSGAHKKYDICDILAGIYPLWFRWTGWHPLCRDYCVPIIMTDEEWYSGKGQQITELPDNLKAWIKDNKKRIQEAKERNTLPYWIKDNEERLTTVRYPSYMSVFSRYSEVMNPTEIGDISLVSEMLDKVMRENPEYFHYGYNGIKAVSRDVGYMTSPLDGTIEINFANSPDGFNPGRELVSAFEKIKGGKPLTFNEEYAIETLWHEIYHNMSSNTVMLPDWEDLMQGFSRVSMETVNQLCARHTYPAFLEQLGGKAVHFDSILEKGYGYSGMVRNLRNVILRAGIDENDFVTRASSLLMVTYEDFDLKVESLLQSLYKGKSDIIWAFKSIERDNIDYLINNLAP